MYSEKDCMRSRVTINLSAIGHNLDYLKRDLPVRKGIIAVIKADGYGHGAVRLAEYLEKREDMAGFAVACPAEATELRANGITKPILILGYVFPEDYEELIRAHVRIPAFTSECVKNLEQAAVKAGEKAVIHIPVDTGMGRIGVMPDERGIAVVKEALSCAHIETEGVFSHFARADERAKTVAMAQFNRFQSFVSKVKEELSFSFSVVHLANSAAMMELKEAAFDWSRAGIAMYGLYPSEELMPSPEALREQADAGYPDTLQPALSWESHVSHVKVLPAGYPISYGGTFVTDKEMRIATIPVGYADGYPRGLSNKGYVLIRGKRAKILGRVCMDQFMADVTEIPDAALGDKVTLIGRDKDERITAEELGDLSGRFNYELVCLITQRVPRIYL